MPDNAGIASGLTLGLGFGLSGVVTILASTLTKHVGPDTAFLVLSGLPLVAAILACRIASVPRALKTVLHPAERSP